MAEIAGDGAANTLSGGGGADTVSGKSGDGNLDGGRGDDVMSAGDGSPTDTFVIRDGDGDDTITDFDPSEPDVIACRMAEIDTIQDFYDRLIADGSDTVVTYDSGDTTRLLNVSPGDLGPANFVADAGTMARARSFMF